MHTATASVKSSSDSLTQRGLAGITEDASEFHLEATPDIKAGEAAKRGDLPRQKSEDSQTRRDRVNGANHNPRRSPSARPRGSLQRSRTLSNTNKALPPTPAELHSVKDIPRSVPRQVDQDPRPSLEGRTSSQSARPTTRDLYDEFGYKQKVKLGPRPSTDSTGRSDFTHRHNEFRPVSTLPAGLRMPTRKATTQDSVMMRPEWRQSQRATPHDTMTMRPQSRQSQRTIQGISVREKPPSIPVTPIQIPDRKAPLISNGLLTPAKTPWENKSPALPSITPEKRRLMKALQIRQKQMAATKTAKSSEPHAIAVEQERTKPDIDDSIIGAIVDASSPDTEQDVIHVPFKDLNKEENRNAEASPISLPEISEGPSTKASSVSEEEEIDTKQLKESTAKGEHLPLANNEVTLTSSGAAGQNALPLPVASDINDDQPKDLITILDKQCTDTSNETSPDPKQHEQEQDSSHQVDSGEQIDTPDDAPEAADATEQATQTAEADVRPNEKTSEIEMCKDPAPIETLGAVPLGKDKPSEETALDKRTTVISSVRVGEQSDDMDTSDLKKPDVPADQDEESQPQENPSLETIDKTQRQTSLKSAPIEDISSDVSRCTTKPRSSSGEVDDIRVAVTSPRNVPRSPIVTEEQLDEELNSAISSTPSVKQSAISKSDEHLQGLKAEDQRLSKDSEATVIQSPISDHTSNKQIRRRGLVDLPQRPLSPEHSDEHFLSDDSFMEELKSATLQEAKPISVSKSPTKPVFSRSESEQRLIDITKTSRSVSSPLDQPSKDGGGPSSPPLPASSSSRSFSASQHLRPESSPPALPKKIGVSSGISQRIKALEQLSSRPTSPQAPSAPSNGPTFGSLRKTSATVSPSTSDPKMELNQRRPTSVYPSPSPSPEAVKSNPFNSMSKAGYSRPESISVKATIVRDVHNKSPEVPRNPAEPRPLDLHQSPLIVERQTMPPPPLSPLKPPRPGYARHSSARSGSTSSTEQKADASPQAPRRGSLASLRSKSSRAGSEVELPRALSDSSLSEITNLDDLRDDRKDSKRSRLMKRMSSISSLSRRSIANALSPGPKEAPIIERQEPIIEAPIPASIEVGDVNVQFPDTLVRVLHGYTLKSGY